MYSSTLVMNFKWLQKNLANPPENGSLVGSWQSIFYILREAEAR